MYLRELVDRLRRGRTIANVAELESNLAREIGGIVLVERNVEARLKLALSLTGSAQMSADWSRQLISPIPLPDGRILCTLRDAAECILEVPVTPSARVAAERIIEAALNGGNMFAAHASIRLALLKAPSPPPQAAPENRGFEPR